MSQNLQLIPLQPLDSNQLQVQNMIKSIQDLDTDEIKKAFQLTKQSYKRTRTAIYPPFPIPAKDCIPTMASIEQTKFYEAQFISVLRGHLDNQTIGDLLKIYSFSDEQIPIGKINFVGSFLQKITAKNISLDVVILCRDLESQNHLVPILQTIGMNCDHLTSHTDKKETFGVIVKIRKADKPRTPIKQATDVDLVLVYDSAVATPNRVLKQFNGIDYARPLIANITTIDSADIRCYNNGTAHKQYNWGTKYKNVQDAQRIFHQPNRYAELEHFFTWNDYIASEVADWVALKQDIPYQFYRPKNHPALKAYSSWGGSYSLSTAPCKPEAPSDTPKAIKAPNAPKAPKAAKAPNAPQNQASGPGAATKSKKKQKIKEEMQQKPAASLPSSNAPHLSSAASASATRTGVVSPSPSSSPIPMQIGSAPSITSAFANLDNAAKALSSNVGSADPIAQGPDYISLSPNSQTKSSIGDKRLSDQVSFVSILMRSLFSILQVN
ncbi:hypothetical protein V8B55DRAFT_1497670 [Mucor lusitanicus]|uniref:Uncharacterized protein n=1 Tax=Mucor circinelloides f. lusitanicus TaxID=29924 RepID=A0A8H4BLV8_MUCCL|nr:hypothetical protein FB192DRAFT_1359245 [Mucor lusitanicus]